MEYRSERDLDPAEYRKLEEFRYLIRRFLNFSEKAAHESGLETQQHQALLALNGIDGDKLPTIRYLADRLLLRHHSAVGLVDRMQALGLVQRHADSEDARQVLVKLTAKGRQVLHRLTVVHREELEEAGPKLIDALLSVSGKSKKHT